MEFLGYSQLHSPAFGLLQVFLELALLNDHDCCNCESGPGYFGTDFTSSVQKVDSVILEPTDSKRT